MRPEITNEPCTCDGAVAKAHVTDALASPLRLQNDITIAIANLQDAAARLQVLQDMENRKR